MNLLFLISLVGTNTSLEWVNFKEAHVKQYKSLQDEVNRLGIFMENKKMISDHNTRHRLGLESYSMKMNHFGDLSDKEFEELYLSEEVVSAEELVSAEEGVTAEEAVANLTAPASCDWRASVPPVRDQGRCGSCWAFSAVGAVEGQVSRLTSEVVPLSPQQLLDCSFGKKYRNHGCRGGLPNSAFRYLADSEGLATEKEYPYKGKESQSVNCRHRGRGVSGLVNIRRGDEEHLAVQLAAVGPVSVCIFATRQFKFYKRGVFSSSHCPKKLRINHAMLAVGYGVSRHGRSYWLVKNSWGVMWGKAGYVKMSKDYDNNCHIASLASYPLLKH